MFKRLKKKIKKKSKKLKVMFRLWLVALNFKISVFIYVINKFLNGGKLGEFNNT